MVDSLAPFFAPHSSTFQQRGKRLRFPVPNFNAHPHPTYPTTTFPLCYIDAHSYPTRLSLSLHWTNVIEQDIIQTRVDRGVKVQRVPIQMRFLSLNQVCFNAPSRICDSAGIKDAEAFATKIFLKVIFGNKRGGLPGFGVGCVGAGGGMGLIKNEIEC